MESKLKLHSFKTVLYLYFTVLYCTVLYCTVPDKLENTFRVSIDFTAFPFTKQLIIYIIKLFPHTQGYNAKESYFRGVRIYCTAVYCLWAIM